MTESTATEVIQPASRWIAIQRNRRSGAGRQYRAVVDLIDELRRQNITPRLFSRRDLLDAEVTRRGTDSLLGIVAAGGDGTVLDVINRHPGIPVAILPLGTENLIARHLGIPRRDGTFVARMIAAGATRKIDLGEVSSEEGTRRFTALVTCGFDADVIHRVHAARKGHITRGSYVRPILRSLSQYPFHELRVFVDENDTSTPGRLAAVANLPRYALNLPMAPNAVPDDGRLDVRVLGHRSLFQLFRDFGNVLLRRRNVPSEVLSITATTVRIESDRPVPVEADGDPVGTTPVTIRVLPAAATLFVPHRN